MKTITYTLLVTVLDATPPTPEGLAAQLERLMEEGTPGYEPYSSAAVSAFEGDFLTRKSADENMRRAKRLHVELRRP